MQGPNGARSDPLSKVNNSNAHTGSTATSDPPFTTRSFGNTPQQAISKRNLSTTIWPLKRLFKKKRSSKPQLTPLNGNGNVNVSAINSWSNSMTSRDWLLSKPRLKRSTQGASRWSITSKLCKSSASPTCLCSWTTYALSGRVSWIWSDFKSPRSLGIIKVWWLIWKRYKTEKAS